MSLEKKNKHYNHLQSQVMEMAVLTPSSNREREKTPPGTERVRFPAMQQQIINLDKDFKAQIDSMKKELLKKDAENQNLKNQLKNNFTQLEATVIIDDVFRVNETLTKKNEMLTKEKSELDEKYQALLLVRSDMLITILELQEELKKSTEMNNQQREEIEASTKEKEELMEKEKSIISQITESFDSLKKSFMSIGFPIPDEDEIKKKEIKTLSEDTASMVAVTTTTTPFNPKLSSGQ